MVLWKETSRESGSTGVMESERFERKESRGEPRGAERRRGFRIRQTRPIKLFEPVGARYLGGQTQDVSSTGLKIELPASGALQVGHVVNVHVGLSALGQSLANRRQMIPSRVVWLRPGMERGRILAGVEFMSSIAAHLDAA